LRLLITGATGFIGSRLTQRALAQGETVRTLTRREWSQAPFVPERDRFFGQLPFLIPDAAFTDVEIVIHCAATSDNHIDHARAINVVGTIRLAEAAREAGAWAFIMLSSQSARADAAAAYGRTKYEAEQALLSLAGIGVTILRPGLVCGRGGLFGRIAGLVERWPVVPIVGAETPVQPIFVGDLIDAILRIAEGPGEFGGRVMQLGAASSIPLGELVSLVASSGSRRRKLFAPIPTNALTIGVRAAERIGIPLPVSSANVAGMRAVRTMVTDLDMQRLGIPDRPVADIIRLALEDRRPSATTSAASPGVDRPSDTLLVGTGRIGLVHAITLSRLPGAFLAGVADRSAAARRLLHSTGVLAPGHPSLDDALAAHSFDAVVLATPPASHLALARQCAERGMAVLIEKPACVGPEQIPLFERLDAATNVPLLVGYLMPGMAHLAGWIERLRRGDLGRVVGFEGFSLLSLMLEPNSQRWETSKEVSGGGVLANSSGHVLSLIHTALGDPIQIHGETRRVVSAEVEDTAIVQLDYGGFEGTHYSSWCIEGFPRQENRLVIRTDRGELCLTISMASFTHDDGTIEMTHQLDYDVGFNLAPDYAGGGIARELNDLSGRGGDGTVGPPMSLQRALGVERLLFAVYAAATEVREFAPVPWPPSGVLTTDGAPAPTAETTGSIRRVLDLRDLDVTATDIHAIPRCDWPEVVVFSNALGALHEAWPLNVTRVTMPNLLRQTRLIGDKRYLQLVQSLGPGGLVGGVRYGAAAALRKRNAGFWVAVTGLLAGELSALPHSFDGTVLLHPYVVDLALALDELRSLDTLLGIVRRERPRARVGLHSNLALAAANAIATLVEPVDELSVLASPNGQDGTLGRVRGWLETLTATRLTRLTAEVGPAPLNVHRLASREPERWAQGADALLVGGMAEPLVYERISPAVRRRWAGSFGGTPLPEAAW
jgi:predicted dehydrogenase/nucleoside-diphosphate-sugar epimerase